MSLRMSLHTPLLAPGAEVLRVVLATGDPGDGSTRGQRRQYVYRHARKLRGDLGAAVESVGSLTISYRGVGSDHRRSRLEQYARRCGRGAARRIRRAAPAALVRSAAHRDAGLARARRGAVHLSRAPRGGQQGRCLARFRPRPGTLRRRQASPFAGRHALRLRGAHRRSARAPGDRRAARCRDRCRRAPLRRDAPRGREVARADHR